jgi:RNA polymerase-associated protein
VKLIDAPRCPYCARVRIALAEKGLAPETVEIDLSNRPAWVYELNETGRVPILDDEFVLPESEVIMAYLDDRYPEPALLPADPAGRARARLLVHRFDRNLGDDYYAFRRGDENGLADKLERLEVGESLYSDIAYVPWVLRARDVLGVELPARLAEWVEGLEQRPSVAAEAAVVRSL